MPEAPEAEGDFVSVQGPPERPSGGARAAGRKARYAGRIDRRGAAMRARTLQRPVAVVAEWRPSASCASLWTPAVQLNLPRMAGQPLQIDSDLGRPSNLPAPFGKNDTPGAASHGRMTPGWRHLYIPWAGPRPHELQPIHCGQATSDGDTHLGVGPAVAALGTREGLHCRCIWRDWTGTLGHPEPAAGVTRRQWHCRCAADLHI